MENWINNLGGHCCPGYQTESSQRVPGQRVPEWKTMWGSSFLSLKKFWLIILNWYGIVMYLCGGGSFISAPFEALYRRGKKISDKEVLKRKAEGVFWTPERRKNSWIFLLLRIYARWLNHFLSLLDECFPKTKIPFSFVN